MNSFKQHQNFQEILSELIDNITIIRNQCPELTHIEKDILLENLRQAYAALLHYSVAEVVASSETTSIIPPEEKEPETAPEKVPIIPIVKEEVHAATPETEKEETVEIPVIEMEPETDDMDTETDNPTKDAPLSIEAEEEFFSNEDFPEEEFIPITQTDAPEYAHPDDDLIAFFPEENQKEKTDSHTSSKKEAKPIEKNQKKEPAPKPAETLFGDEQTIYISKTEKKTEVRSLNDLLHVQMEEHSLLSKIQKTKIDDLSKAISINDKFLYIKELFKNQGEEFSKAIQTLNQCRNIDEAFEEIEKLKKYYYWDSTSTAYLSLCDLIRRKFA